MYYYDEEEYSENITDFFSKMVLFNLFSKLSEEFSFNDFEGSFRHVFYPNRDVNVRDEAVDAFMLAIETGLIENVNKENGLYVFNGLGADLEENFYN